MRVRFAAALSLWCLAACSDSTGPSDVSLVARLPANSLLSASRIAQFAGADADQWYAYAAASVRAAEADRKRIDDELDDAGLAQPIPAPAGTDFSYTTGVPVALSRTLADVILSFQTPSGGWSKAVDFTRGPRLPGQSWSSTSSWSWIGTFDNGATTEELRFLGAYVNANASADAKYATSFRRGVEYILAAQFPNGCWPQVYPLEGGYHDAATYNDDTTVRILYLLSVVRDGKYPFVPGATRTRARNAIERGSDCILYTQVALTVWGQQHDPLTLAPIAARAYEPAGLSSAESTGILYYLMSIQLPDADVVRAVHAAAAWLQQHAILGYRYQNGVLSPSPGDGPLWARLYELDTHRPIFGDRDGSIHYDVAEISEERRLGYAWYVTWPATALLNYVSWARGR